MEHGRLQTKVPNVVSYLLNFAAYLALGFAFYGIWLNN